MMVTQGPQQKMLRKGQWSMHRHCKVNGLVYAVLGILRHREVVIERALRSGIKRNIEDLSCLRTHCLQVEAQFAQYSSDSVMALYNDSKQEQLWSHLTDLQ